MIKSLIIIVLAMTVVACQSSPRKPTEPTTSSGKNNNPQEGQLFTSLFKKRAKKSITLPPDLVGSANEQVRLNHEQVDAEAEIKVLPKVDNAKIVNADGKRWLRVESDAHNVWDTLTDFWAAEQIALVESKPAAGQMETDWIAASQTAADASGRKFFTDLFNRIVGNDTAYDKYTIRLERDGDAVTNIHVTHRSTRKQPIRQSAKEFTGYEWVDSGNDQEKVAQLLQVMVLLFAAAS